MDCLAFCVHSFSPGRILRSTRHDAVTELGSKRVVAHSVRENAYRWRATAQVPQGQSTANSPPANSTSTSGQKRFTEINRVYKTGGGWIVDATVHNFRKTTTHTVILGNEIMEELCEGLEGRPDPGDVVKYVFAYFMQKGQNLTNTEGLLDSGSFPINYFAVRQVFYFFPDAKEKISGMIVESLRESS